MKREYYSDSIANFRNSTHNEILGELALNSDFSLERIQRSAWLAAGFALWDFQSLFFSLTLFSALVFSLLKWAR
jgi:hypothetical protein